MCGSAIIHIAHPLDESFKSKFHFLFVPPKTSQLRRSTGVIIRSDVLGTFLFCSVNCGEAPKLSLLGCLSIVRFATGLGRKSSKNSCASNCCLGGVLTIEVSGKRKLRSWVICNGSGVTLFAMFCVIKCQDFSGCLQNLA